MKKSNVVYVNPNFASKTRSRDDGAAAMSRGVGVHINPNFKGKYDEVFENAFSEQRARNIHINPRILQINRPICSDAPKHSDLCLPIGNTAKSQYLINNKNKIVKRKVEEALPKPKTVVTSNAPQPSTSFLSKKPQYSLIRKDTTKQVDLKAPHIVDVKRVQKENTHNVDLKKKHNQSGSMYSLYRIRKRSNKGHLQKVKLGSCQSERFKAKKKAPREKVSSNKLITKGLSTKHIYIGGERFVINNNVLHKVQNKMPAGRDKPNVKSVKKINLCGVTYIRKSESVFVMDNRMKNLIKKRKKINITCPIFRRLGVCKMQSKGKCPLIHDPKYVSICQNFLKGKCDMNGCHLSHDIVLEKMPTCKFFLEGCCTKQDCVYLHVKVNQGANICKPFLNGYCEKGVHCEFQHAFVCPEFFKHNVCNKTKCPYPHKALTKTSEPKLPEKCTLPLYARNDAALVNKSDHEHTKSSRYFEEGGSESVHDKNEEVLYKGRRTLGELPSYIALDS